MSTMSKSRPRLLHAPHTLNKVMDGCMPACLTNWTFTNAALHEFYAVRKRRSTHHEALKLWNTRSCSYHSRCNLMESSVPYHVHTYVSSEISTLSKIGSFMRVQSFFLSRVRAGCGLTARPSLSQLWSFKIRSTAFPNYIKFADLLISRL